jgi:hypothetical protein
MKSAVMAAAVMLFATATAGAAPLNLEVRGDGACDVVVGTSMTAIGEVRGAALGRADYSLSLDLGAVAYALPGGGSCTAADGSITFDRKGSLLVTDVAGVVCSPNGSDLVFKGVYVADAAASTAPRYEGNTGAGNLVVGCYGSVGGGAGFAAAAHANGTLRRP